MPVDQVCIGSCTNSSYHDLMAAAAILKGRRVHPRVSLGIAPGSRQVLRMLVKNGALSDLIAAGGRVMESACGFCVGNHFSPRSGGVSVRTSNRNFEGRSGTKDAKVYLASPEAAAVAAVTGQLADPRAFGMPYPKIAEPETYLIDDSMFVFPTPEMADTPIVRGPNIGEPPRNGAMPPDLDGVCSDQSGRPHHDGPHHACRSTAEVPLERPEVRPLCLREHRPRLCRHLHGEQGPGRAQHHRGGRLLRAGVEPRARGALPHVPGRQGGHREVVRAHPRCKPCQLRHNPDGLRRRGRLRPDSRRATGSTAAGWRDAVAKGAPVIVRNGRTGETFACICPISEKQRAIVAAGGLLNYVSASREVRRKRTPCMMAED